MWEVEVVGSRCFSFSEIEMRRGPFINKNVVKNEKKMIKIN